MKWNNYRFCNNQGHNGKIDIACLGVGAASEYPQCFINIDRSREQKKVIDQYKDEDKEKLFILKPLYQRSIIVAAGPLANFLLAIVVFTMINIFIGKDITPAVIDEVQENSPAFISGFKKNDVILSVDNKKTESILQVSTYINISSKETIEFVIKRDDREVSLFVKPIVIEDEDLFGNLTKKKLLE